MPFLATQRKDLKGTMIPAVNLATGKLDHINLANRTFTATQPDEIEDTEFNTYVNIDNTPYLVQSIDMEDAPQ